MKENKKKAKATPTKKASLSGAKRTRRIVIILVSVLVGIAVVLGAVLGIVSAVRRASHVMRLEDIGINEGVASYLSSVFKSMYMQNLASSGVSVSDTESFWNTLYFWVSNIQPKLLHPRMVKCEYPLYLYLWKLKENLRLFHR